MMETRIKHNCTKENKFEFVYVALSKDTKDRIKCEICGREWEEVK